MGHAGKNKTTVATTLSVEIADEFERRASSLGKTKGAYLRDILVDWYERGAPPVGKLDELVQRSQIAEDQAAYDQKKKTPPKKTKLKAG